MPQPRLTCLRAQEWRQIHDFLVEFGSRFDGGDYCQAALENLAGLVPYDSARMFIKHEASGREEHMLVGITSQNFDAYRKYYHRLNPVDPDLYRDPTRGVTQVDWREYRHTEYVTDFISPQGIRRCAGMLLYDSRQQPVGGLFLNRAPNSPQFNRRELAVMGILQIYLSHYLSIYTKLANQENSHFHPTELNKSCRLLSKREAEVATLLCHRLTANEIAAKLLISPLTAKKHIENIYGKLGVKSRQELVGKLLGRNVQAER
ncbi:MAG: LuxR C-terminal-related transcriptional regulator [Bacteroidota bacterium]